MITTRVLPPDEYWKIARDLPESPLAQVAFADLQGVVCVAEEGDVVLGIWCLIMTWHAEPVYVTPTRRRQGLVASAVAHALYSQLQETMRASGVETALVVIEDPALQPTVQRMGFTPVPGALYYATAPASPGEDT